MPKWTKAWNHCLTQLTRILLRPLKVWLALMYFWKHLGMLLIPTMDAVLWHWTAALANPWAVCDSAWCCQMRNEMGSQWHQCFHRPETAHTLATSPGIVLHLEEPRARSTNIRSDSSTEESSEYLRSRKHWLWHIWCFSTSTYSARLGSA